MIVLRRVGNPEAHDDLVDDAVVDREGAAHHRRDRELAQGFPQGGFLHVEHPLPGQQARVLEGAEQAAEHGLGVDGAVQRPTECGQQHQTADGQPDPALSTLLDAVREGPGDTRDKARGLMLDVFRLLGDDHPLTARYRKDLTRALF